MFDMNQMSGIYNIIKKIYHRIGIDGERTFRENMDLVFFAMQDLISYSKEMLTYDEQVCNVFEHTFIKRLNLLMLPKVALNSDQVIFQQICPVPRFSIEIQDKEREDLLSIIKDCTPTTPFALQFGQTQVNSSFQHSPKAGQTPRENLLLGQSILGKKEKLVKMLGYGMGCRIGFFKFDGGFVVSNNRTYAAHCLCEARPLRLYYMPTPDMEDVNRLREVSVSNKNKKNTTTFNSFSSLASRKNAMVEIVKTAMRNNISDQDAEKFTTHKLLDATEYGSFTRPKGIDVSFRTLPSNWMPIEDNTEKKIIAIAQVPYAWDKF